MATNIYGRRMFNGGTIRTAPRRFQEGTEVVANSFEFSQPTNPPVEDVTTYIVGTAGNQDVTEKVKKLGRDLWLLKINKDRGFDVQATLRSMAKNGSLDIAKRYYPKQVEMLMQPTISEWIISNRGKGIEFIGEQLTPTSRSFDPKAARQAKRILNRGEQLPKLDAADIRDFAVPKEKPTPPVRRQAGGGIEAVMPGDLGALVEQPPMPIAAPPPVEEALPRVEQAAANVAEEEVGNYAANMMSGLDAAEESGDPEDAINALRGNELPISERYEELATYVGEDDAERTPESVLLMVQPTIMLTEQGAMDSGIGSLMQDLVGEVEMETDVGTPTPMGEGVGSLMMAQGPSDMEVGQEPPVNFNYGGPVQRFNGEFGSEVRKAADQRSALLSDYLGLGKQEALDQEALNKLRETTQAQTFFDIAQAGLNLAAGDPYKSFAENFAISAAPVAANLSARGAAFAKEERDLDKLRRAQEQKIKLSAFETESERIAKKAALKEKRGYEKELTKKERAWEEEQAEKDRANKLAVAKVKEGGPKKNWYGHRKFGWKLLTEEEARADTKNIIPGLVAKVGTGVPKPRTLLKDSPISRGFLQAADSTDKIPDLYVSIATDLVLNAPTRQSPINVEISAEGVSPTAQRPKQDRFLRAAKKILDRDYLTQNKIIDKTGTISKNVDDLNKDEVTTLVNLYFPNAEDIRKIVEEPLPSKIFGALKTTFGAAWPSQAGGENVENRNAVKLFDHMWKQYIYQNLPRLSKPEREGMADLFTGLWPTLQKTPSDAKKYVEITLIPQLNNYIKHMTDRINAMNEEDKNTVEETLTLRQLRAMREPWLQYIAGEDNKSKAFNAKSDAVQEIERKRRLGFYGRSKNPNNTGRSYRETEQFKQMQKIGKTP
jgi:hypothetical protein